MAVKTARRAGNPILVASQMYRTAFRLDADPLSVSPSSNHRQQWDLLPQRAEGSKGAKTPLMIEVVAGGAPVVR